MRCWDGWGGGVVAACGASSRGSSSPSFQRKTTLGRSVHATQAVAAANEVAQTNATAMEAKFNADLEAAASNAETAQQAAVLDAQSVDSGPRDAALAEANAQKDQALAEVKEQKDKEAMDQAAAVAAAEAANASTAESTEMAALAAQKAALDAETDVKLQEAWSSLQQPRSRPLWRRCFCADAPPSPLSSASAHPPPRARHAGDTREHRDFERDSRAHIAPTTLTKPAALPPGCCRKRSGSR